MVPRNSNRSDSTQSSRGSRGNEPPMMVILRLRLEGREQWAAIAVVLWDNVNFCEAVVSFGNSVGGTAVAHSTLTVVCKST